jgi:hypothetical protein
MTDTERIERHIRHQADRLIAAAEITDSKLQQALYDAVAADIQGQWRQFRLNDAVIPVTHEAEDGLPVATAGAAS